MPASCRKPGEEPIGEQCIGIGKLFQDASKVVFREMRGHEDAGVLRQLHGNSRRSQNFGGPALAPRYPRLVQRPKVVDVVCDERPPVFSCTKENLDVRQSAATEFFGRIDVPTLRAEQTGKPVGDILVKDDPQVRHVLGKSGRIRLEQGVDGAAMFFVVEQRRLNCLKRNVVGRGGLGDHLIGDSVRLGRARYGVDVSDKCPDRNAFGQEPAPCRSRPVRIWTNHASQMVTIGDGRTRRSVVRFHGAVSETATIRGQRHSVPAQSIAEPVIDCCRHGQDG